MKKLFFLIALVMLIGVTACSNDKDEHGIQSSQIDEWIMGAWYDESMNEEMRFNPNGVFYDRFANVSRCAETEGRWEYDDKNKRLTYYYQLLGDNIFQDMTVKDKSEFGFTISSRVTADVKLEKIVETHVVKANANGQELIPITFIKDYPGYEILSYYSTNPRIADANDGHITLHGEKGTAYIKLSTKNFNVWSKVVVGDDCLDLWYDYVSVIGMDYYQMSRTMSQLVKPFIGEDGYSYQYVNNIHDVIDKVNIFLCPEDGLVTEIQLVLRNAVPEVEVLSYMKSHYFYVGENSNYIFFYPVSNVDESTAIIGYNRSTSVVVIDEKSHFFETAHIKDLWPDFSYMFGITDKAVNDEMTKLDCQYSFSDYSYSKDGSDYYSIDNNDYVGLVGFVFNPEIQMSEYWIYLKNDFTPSSIYEFLTRKYNVNTNESETYSNGFVFDNDDRTVKIVFNAIDGYVRYTKLTMKQHDPVNTDSSLLGNYYEGLGKTHEEISSLYGNPFSSDNKTMVYLKSGAIKYVYFSFDEDTEKCIAASLIMNDEATDSEIKDYLKSIYTVFAKGTSDDGSQFAYINGDSLEDATIGIIFYPKGEYRMIQYVDLSKTRSRSSFCFEGININVSYGKQRL